MQVAVLRASRTAQRLPRVWRREAAAGRGQAVSRRRNRNKEVDLGSTHTRRPWAEGRTWEVRVGSEV